jgi:AcrR family transcriptional regulator
MRGRPSKREQILQVATRLIGQRGVGHFTLDAVAEEAQISKGGLLYHFPTKEDLVMSMINSIMDEFTVNMVQSAEADPVDTGKWSRAYIQETLKVLDGTQSMSFGLLSISSENPELLKPVQEHFSTWQRYIEQDGLDPVKATIIRLTMDGLWFTELLGCPTVEPELRRKVLETLFQMTKEDLT